MNLGGGSFKYVPMWRGNRDLPLSERLSLRVHPLRGIDILAEEMDREAVEVWVEDALGDYAEAKREELKRMDLTVARILRRVIEHTSDYQGFVFDDGEVADATGVLLRIPIRVDAETETDNLLVELGRVLRETANLAGDEVKNYEKRCSGSITPTTENAPTAEEEDAPASADTR